MAFSHLFIAFFFLLLECLFCFLFCHVAQLLLNSSNKLD
uniref:Uncharacterized protein n=1 Tax=Rhizophora mucronata TaxID=61149 RepID=A0A2P2QH87_RHIMU